MFSARVEAVGHDRDDTATVLQGGEGRDKMPMGRERIFGAGGIAGEGRVHDYDSGPFRDVLVDLGSVEGGNAVFGE